MEDEGRRVLRLTPERARADEWALVLSSAGVPSLIEWSLRGYAVLVEGRDGDYATEVLATYDAENRPPPAPPPAPELQRTRAAILTAVALAGFFVVTGPRDGDSVWFARGAADAARIGLGEWWRSITALTLHADFPHILANAVTLIIFGSSLCALVGPGAGLWLLLLSGTGGNLITAWLHAGAHSAVGASTAIFGAIGALAGLQLIRRRRDPRISRWRVFAPVAAGFGLLALLGTSPQSDVLAHLFGFALGAVLGALLGWLRPRPLAPALQWLLVVAAVVVVVGSWLRALL